MSYEEGKEKIISEIDELREEMTRNSALRLNTQKEILGIIGQAIDILDMDMGSIGLQRAKSILVAARKRIQQAERQQGSMPQLPLSIGAYLFVVLGLLGWLIFKNPNIFWDVPDPWEVMFGVVLWSTVGSVTFALWDIGMKVTRQELDFNLLSSYLFHPLTGAAIGAILFLIVHGGLLALTENAGDYNPILLYALGALGGFWQQQVIQFFRNTFENLLRVERGKNEDLK